MPGILVSVITSVKKTKRKAGKHITAQRSGHFPLNNYATVRDREVGGSILSPRPTTSIAYGSQRWRPYFICGEFVDNLLRRHFPLELDSPAVTHSHLQILMAHERHYCERLVPSQGQARGIRSDRRCIADPRRAVCVEADEGVVVLSCVRRAFALAHKGVVIAGAVIATSRLARRISISSPRGNR